MRKTYYARSPITGMYLGDGELFDEPYDSAFGFESEEELVEKLQTLAEVGGQSVEAELVLVFVAEMESY